MSPQDRMKKVNKLFKGGGGGGGGVEGSLTSREPGPSLGQGRPWQADALKTLAWALRHACCLPSDTGLGAMPNVRACGIR